jgi:hypothetical protein
LKKNYVEINKDKNWNEKQMDENFKKYKTQLLEDIGLIYKDNNLNVLIKETDMTFDNMLKSKRIDVTDQYVDFEYDPSNPERGVNDDVQPHKSMINLYHFKKSFELGHTLFLSNTIAHEAGHGFLDNLMRNFGWNENCLGIENKKSNYHHTAYEVPTNLMSSGGNRYGDDVPLLSGTGTMGYPSYPKSYALLRKSNSGYHKDKMAAFTFTNIHKSNIRTFLKFERFYGKKVE